MNKPTLARIVADITGDGHLQIQEWRHLVSFYSKNMEEIDAVKKRFYDLFGVEGRIYTDNRRTNGKETLRYKLFFISKPVALFLRDVGMPVGNKTNIPFVVPGWIINGKPEIRSAYLQGLFDTEGSIFCRASKARWQIGLKMAKNEAIIDDGTFYINQIRQMLADFNIHCSPVRKNKLNTRKDGSKSFELQFNIEKSSFRNFYKYVGFGNSKKHEKLIFALAPVTKRLR